MVLQSTSNCMKGSLKAVQKFVPGSHWACKNSFNISRVYFEAANISQPEANKGKHRFHLIFQSK